jgi:hypothetical protein
MHRALVLFAIIMQAALGIQLHMLAQRMVAATTAGTTSAEHLNMLMSHYNHIRWVHAL